MLELMTYDLDYSSGKVGSLLGICVSMRLSPNLLPFLRDYDAEHENINRLLTQAVRAGSASMVQFFNRMIQCAGSGFCMASSRNSLHARQREQTYFNQS
jgi:hypothetical protein